MKNKGYYGELCSIQIGKNWRQYSKFGWPCAAFRIYPGKITFKLFFGKWKTLEKKQIKSLDFVKFFINGSLIITHSNPNIKPYLVFRFKPFFRFERERFSKILDALKKAGFSVKHVSMKEAMKKHVFKK